MGLKPVLKESVVVRIPFAIRLPKLSVQNNANIFELQAILGHTSFEIVKTYVNLFGNDVRNRHREFSPLRMLNNLIKPD
jgi:integrase/recombinase XerD